MKSNLIMLRDLLNIAFFIRQKNRIRCCMINIMALFLLLYKGSECNEIKKYKNM